MRGAALLAVALGLSLASCSSLGSKRLAACEARARAATVPAGFTVEQGKDTGETRTGGMATVTFYTGDGSGNSKKKQAICFFSTRTDTISNFTIVDL